MRIGAFDFKPGFWPSIATLVLLPFLFGLGIWQLERADWKQGLVDQHTDSTKQPPVLLESLLPGMKHTSIARLQHVAATTLNTSCCWITGHTRGMPAITY